MPRKLTTGQAPYQLLVANLTRGSDPSRNSGGNPVKARTMFTYQHLPEVNREGQEHGPEIQSPKTPGLATRMGLLEYPSGIGAIGATAEIVVADNDFSDPATLYIGSYALVSDEDFVVGAGTAATAVNLAAAIDALPGFTAPVPGASTVTVTGPPGPGGNDVLFEATYMGAIENFTLTPTTGSFEDGEPVIGPPEITP